MNDHDDDTASSCSNCGRPLKYPAADGLGPVCRRRARAEAEQAAR
jgi:hypothetical protein